MGKYTGSRSNTPNGSKTRMIEQQWNAFRLLKAKCCCLPTNHSLDLRITRGHRNRIIIHMEYQMCLWNSMPRDTQSLKIERLGISSYRGWIQAVCLVLINHKSQQQWKDLGSSAHLVILNRNRMYCLISSRTINRRIACLRNAIDLLLLILEGFDNLISHWIMATWVRNKGWSLLINTSRTILNNSLLGISIMHIHLNWIRSYKSRCLSNRRLLVSVHAMMWMSVNWSILIFSHWIISITTTGWLINRMYL